MRTTVILLAVLAATFGALSGQARENLSFPAAGTAIVDTYVRPDVSGVAWVTRGGDGEHLFVDGQEVAREERIDQVHLNEAAEVTYWAGSGKQQVVVYRGQEGPQFDSIYVPDLKVLAALGTPGPTEWAFLGGTRVAFAARDRKGEWTALLRFPAAWQNQENRPLPLTRVHYESPDPASRTHRPLRYRLLKDKVPVYIGRRGDEECLVIGLEVAACGKQVSLLAVAPDSSQVAFGMTTPKGIDFYSSFGVIGPTNNVDWVSFSPDGRHLACVVRQGSRQAVYVDGQLRSVHEAVAGVVWLPDNRLLSLVHGAGGSQVLMDGKPVLEKKLIERLFVAPDARVQAVGKDDQGAFVHPQGRPGKFTSIWGEGFLRAGTFFGLLRLPDGKVSLLRDGEVTAPYSAISRLAPSPNGEHLVAVGASVDGDAVLLDGLPWQPVPGRVERFAWCGGEHLQVMVRGADLQCLVAADREPVCCDRFVATGCNEEGVPYFVCLSDGRYVFRSVDGSSSEPFDDVPLQFVYQDHATGSLSFAGRRGTEWTLVLSGQVTPLQGAPVQALPSSDRAWYQVKGEAGTRWHTRIGATDTFDSVSAPMEYDGVTLFRARLNGRESFADDARIYGWHEAIVSTLYPVPGGFLYWALDEGQFHLVALEL